MTFVKVPRKEFDELVVNTLLLVEEVKNMINKDDVELPILQTIAKAKVSAKRAWHKREQD